MAQTLQAVFVSGDPVMIPYTPVGAIAAGEVVVENGVCMIAHLPIAAGALGAMAIGGGIYSILATSGDLIDRFDSVYWDDTGNNAEESATSNTKLGFASVAKVDGDLTVHVFHQFPNF